MKKNTLLIFPIILLFAFCTDHEKLLERDYPVLETLEVATTSPNLIIFNANNIGFNQTPVDDFGFVWGQANLPSLTNSNSDSKSLGSADQLEHFSYNSPALQKNTSYYVAAYAICKGKTIYGNTVSFKLK